MAQIEHSIWRSLQGGGSLDHLGLLRRKGRFVLEGFKAPPGTLQGEPFTVKSLLVQRVSQVPRIIRRSWQDIEFVGCDLSHIGFVSCRVENCVFSDCKCSAMAFWESSIADCGFVNSDLSGAVMGSTQKSKPRPNEFVRVEFNHVDLTGSHHSAERYVSCSFQNCRAANLAFWGTVFEDCRLVGHFERVQFMPQDSEPISPTRNRMLRCDLSSAEFRSCEFCKIDLDTVTMPSELSHVILMSGPGALARWRSEFVAHWTSEQCETVEWLIDTVGKPSFLHVDDLAIFSSAEVDRLRKIDRDLAPR